MLTKSLSLAGAVSVTAMAVWLAASSVVACSSDDPAVPSPDAGNQFVDSGQNDAGNASSSSSSGGNGQIPADAGLVDPATVDGVDIPFKTCDPFTKCDGSVVGNWKIVSGCLSDQAFSGYSDLCPGLTPHDVVIKAKGTVAATASTIAQNTTVFLSAKMDVPKSCAALASGFSSGTVTGCAALGGLLTSPLAPQKFDHAVCVDKDESTCLCAADINVPEATNDTYTTTGGTLTTTDSPSRTCDYCPANNQITYHETTKSNPTFGMFFTVAPQ